MNIHPLSHASRKLMSPARYRDLSRNQRHKSLIGFLASEWEFSSRIAELEELESEGFIYCGEKYWLKDFIASGKDPSLADYGVWVEQFFKSVLGLTFSINEGKTNADNRDLRDQRIWSAAVDIKKYLLGFEQLANPIFQPLSVSNMLSINVIGSSHQPSLAHLCSAYEFLHGLEFFIAEMRYETENEFSPFEIIGIDVANHLDPRQWGVVVLSEYGSVFDFILVDYSEWS